MPSNQEIAVLVCCHYSGGGQSLLELSGALEESLRSRGLRGRIIETKTLFDIADLESATKRAVALVGQERYRKIVDTFEVAIQTETEVTHPRWKFWKSKEIERRTSKHSVVVYS